MQKKLKKKELAREFRDLAEGWKFNTTHTSISLTLDHIGYVDALIFVSKLIVYAEVRQQSPSITLSKNKIRISLVAPAKLGLTKEIFDFAKLIDGLSLSTVIRQR